MKRRKRRRELTKRRENESLGKHAVESKNLNCPVKSKGGDLTPTKAHDKRGTDFAEGIERRTKPCMNLGLSEKQLPHAGGRTG